MSSRETAKARPSADHAAASGRKRVAIVTLHPRHGGGILSMMQWGYELFRKLGYDPVLHFLSDQPPDNLSWRRLNFRARTSRTTWLGMNAVRIGMRHSFIEYGNYRFNLDLWKRALEGFDLYFAITGGAHHALPLALLDKPFGMWVATAHSDDVESRLRSKSLVPGWLRRYETKSLERDEARVMAKAKQILALSEHTREKLAKVYPPARDRMLIAPFPVDIERFRPGERSKESGDYIMAVGRFSDARKNIELLIRAFDLVARRHPDLELWLAGEPPEPRFRQLGEDLGLGNRIRYLGEMPREQLVPLYQGAKVVALSSWQEGLGIAVLESMACGTPVISTRCGGPEDIIREGEDGFLVPLSDARALAEKLVVVLDDDALRSKMGERARARVVDKFSRAAVTNVFLDCIEALDGDLVPH